MPLQYVESLNMARGCEQSPDGPIRIQLESQEANAAALMGNSPGAREALKRVEMVCNATPVTSSDVRYADDYRPADPDAAAPPAVPAN
jgi:hypothetical protein